MRTHIHKAYARVPCVATDMVLYLPPRTPQNFLIKGCDVMKINIKNKSQFNVLIKGHIFICVSDNDCKWDIYEIYPWTLELQRIYTNCYCRFDCLTCLRWFYGE